VTYYGGKELAASFRTVRQNTIQIAQDVPEDKYSVTAAPDTRSIAQTLVHLALSPRFQLHVHQNKIDDLKQVNFPELMRQIGAEESRSRTKAEILALLTSEGEAYAAYLESLPEDFLAERVAMPPGAQPATKSRFEMLLSPKEHEMHHRGQLMMLQRIIGQKPHLTRQMEERSAQRATQAPQASR
jgi:uncharacterized damage-inducible protein DinB